MYEIEEKSFHFATYLPSLLYDVLSGLICASKYERDRDKWSRPTVIFRPERQGIGKLSTLRLRGRAGDSVSLAVSSNPAQIEIATVVLWNKAIILKTEKVKKRKNTKN